MYFAFGPPKVFSVRGGDVVWLETSPRGGVMALLTAYSVQLWGMGQHRLCVGLAETDADLGTLEHAEWRKDGRRFCVVTSKAVLLTFDVTPVARPGSVESDDPSPWKGHDTDREIEPYKIDHGPATFTPTIDWAVSDTTNQSTGAVHKPTLSLKSTLPIPHGTWTALCSDPQRLYVATSCGNLLVLGWGGAAETALLQVISVAGLSDGLSTPTSYNRRDSHSLTPLAGASTPNLGPQGLKASGSQASMASLSTTEAVLEQSIMGKDFHPVGHDAAVPDPCVRQWSGARGGLSSASLASAPAEPLVDPSTPESSTFARGNVVETLHCSLCKVNELAATMGDGTIVVMRLLSGTAGTPLVHEFTGSRTAPIPGIAPGHRSALNSRKALLAVSHGAKVVLHDLYSPLHKKAVLSLELWGYTADDVGAVASLRWSPDEEVLAVGYAEKGLAVFHWTGACLMTTLPRCGEGPTSSHVASCMLKCAPVALAWDPLGYHLLVSFGAAAAGKLAQLEFAKSAVLSCPSVNRGPRVVLVTSKSVLLFRHPDLDFLKDNWEPLSPPPVYAEANGPIRYASVSADGQHFCVVGARGCALYQAPLKKWRLFSVADQEQELDVVAAPVWCSNTVICLPARRIGVPGEYALYFYPRTHLDQRSLLLTVPMKGRPELLDACVLWQEERAGYILFSALDVDGRVLSLHIKAYTDSVMKPSKVALSVESQQLFTLDVAGPIAFLRLLPTPPCFLRSAPSPTHGDGEGGRGAKGFPAGKPAGRRSAETRAGAPAALVLTQRGELILVSFAHSWRAVLSRNVAAFWIDPILADHGFVHVLVSGPKKTVLLALLHPMTRRVGGATAALQRRASKETASAKATGPLSPLPAPPHTTTLLQDADTDACPIGILTGEGLLVSATEGVRSPSSVHPTSYHVHARNLPYLHAVLLALFIGESSPDSDPAERAACAAAAVEVAKELHEHSFFIDVMDYLLHAVLHCHDIVESHSHQIERPAVLRLVLRFLSNYPEFHEILVHCLRKADPGVWPLVFSQCPPFRLFETALQAGRITDAALLLRVLQMPMLDDPTKELRVAASAARRLFPLTLARNKFALSAELLRFLKLLRTELLFEQEDGESPANGTGDEESGLVINQQSNDDPLIGSAYLRTSAVAKGRKLLAAGAVQDLHLMLSILGFSTASFISHHWASILPTQPAALANMLTTVFMEMHTQFSLPFATSGHVFPAGADASPRITSEKIAAKLAGYSRLLSQWKQSSGFTQEAEAILSNPLRLVTPTQSHLVLVPIVLAQVLTAAANYREARAPELAVLSALLLLDLNLIRSLVDEKPTLREALDHIVTLPNFSGYRPILRWLDGS
ncbi:hypothetical protein DIPPA_29561 [Diplonema papillatum]|nr:hypothetical protein DIPPA_29561 [Diplonema papillatum]